MDDFLDLNASRDPKDTERLAGEALEIIGQLLDAGRAPVVFAMKLSEEQMNAVPYEVRNGLYEWAKGEFAFNALYRRWLRARVGLEEE